MLTKFSVKKLPGTELKESILIYEDGVYNYNKQVESSNEKPIIGKLAESELDKLKVFVSYHRIKSLKENYYCKNESPYSPNTLFSFPSSLGKKKITIDEDCPMPKELNELNNFLETVIAKN